MGIANLSLPTKKDQAPTGLFTRYRPDQNNVLHKAVCTSRLIFQFFANVPFCGQGGNDLHRLANACFYPQDTFPVRKIKIPPSVLLYKIIENIL